MGQVQVTDYSKSMITPDGFVSPPPQPAFDAPDVSVAALAEATVALEACLA